MKYFQVYELVSEAVYDVLGDDALRLFNPGILIALVNLRDFFGVQIIVNNWHSGGEFSRRGYRTKLEQTAVNPAAGNSAHRAGRAFDVDVKGVSPEDVRKQLLANKDHPLLAGIMRIEGKVNWLHFDNYPVPERIFVF